MTHLFNIINNKIIFLQTLKTTLGNKSLVGFGG